MLLTFSKIQFIDRIISGNKIHTIRDDKFNRWKVGNKIHFWFGNPRNTRGKIKPFQFAIGEVQRIENIFMDLKNDIVLIGYDILKSTNELNTFASNDGFDSWNKMKLWFDNHNKQYYGKIIFWKPDFIYLNQTTKINKI